MADRVSVGRTSGSLRKILVPLALAQFICSFAGSNMNVMITDISKDLDTTVQGVQVAITVFLLVMAALMIPGGKLTDRWGRKRCFTIGLTIYGIGALMSAVSPGLGVLILGNSIFEGVGTALLIPPVYILTTLLFSDITSRARAFGVITGMGGVGAAAGPLIGGSHHHGNQLAGGVRLPSHGRRGDRLPEPLDRRPDRARSDPPLRHPGRGPVGRRPGPGRDGGPRSRQQPRCSWRSCWPSEPSSSSGSSSTFAPENAKARSRCCRLHSSETERRISVSSRRTCSGCCSSEPRSSSRPTSRSFVATTPSKPA